MRLIYGIIVAEEKDKLAREDKFTWVSTKLITSYFFIKISICLHPQPCHGGQYMVTQLQPMQADHRISADSGFYGQQMAGYCGHGQQQGSQYLEQRLYGLSVRDNGIHNSCPVSTSSYVPPSKSFKPEDKLFDDLVDIAKFKSSVTKSPSSRAGSM
ncbi:TOM1-like protein 9 [Cannabis sativa]|uniref:TOM1-like protein 9 n=1 Tax=Cannabis sativa TaxID=3483 RepID=UPI0029CAA2B2|nr:TOM1-like protein 9 [Cannabis sativa]